MYIIWVHCKLGLVAIHPLQASVGTTYQWFKTIPSKKFPLVEQEPFLSEVMPKVHSLHSPEMPAPIAASSQRVTDSEYKAQSPSLKVGPSIVQFMLQSPCRMVLQ